MGLLEKFFLKGINRCWKKWFRRKISQEERETKYVSGLFLKAVSIKGLVYEEGYKRILSIRRGMRRVCTVATASFST